MRLQLRLNLRRLVLALIALLSFGAILLKQSDGYLRASAAVQTVAIVNAASYEPGPLARGSLASVFGNKLAAQTLKSKEVPLPVELGNVSIQLTDSANQSPCGAASNPLIRQWPERLLTVASGLGRIPLPKRSSGLLPGPRMIS